MRRCYVNRALKSGALRNNSQYYLLELEELSFWYNKIILAKKENGARGRSKKFLNFFYPYLTKKIFEVQFVNNFKGIVPNMNWGVSNPFKIAVPDCVTSPLSWGCFISFFNFRERKS